MIWKKESRRELLGLAISLVIALALVSLVSSVPSALAMEGTTDYSVFFNSQRVNGDVFDDRGDEGFRVASTENENTSERRGSPTDPAAMYESGSGLLSKTPISFEQDWKISISANCPKPTADGNHANDTTYRASSINIAFGDRATIANSNRIAGVFGWTWTGKDTNGADMFEGRIRIGKIDSTTGWDNSSEVSNVLPSSTHDEVTLTMEYESQSDLITFTAYDTATERKISALSIGGVKNSMGGQAYLSITGAITWTNQIGVFDQNTLSRKLNTVVKFNSMTLPHLEPDITSVTFVDSDGKTVDENNPAKSGSVVKVTCKIKNSYTSETGEATSEKFPMHLSLSPTAQGYSTEGLELIISNEQPLKVGDSIITTSESDFASRLNSSVPLTLDSDDEVIVTFYAKVNENSSKKASLGLELIEEFFKGTHREKANLPLEIELIPGSMGPNPVGAGTNYHYTRLPAPNANGWNNSTVNVKFFAGDFDRFTVKDNSGTALGTLGDNQIWSKKEDVDALSVSYQAQNTSTGSSSRKAADVIRIDTHAPELSYNAATGTLQAADNASGSNVNSGIWKIERVRANGRSLDTQGVTPQAVALTDRAASSQSNWTFPLSDGKGALSQTVANVEEGYYVAEDAAGNRSEVFEVKKSAYPPVTPRPTDDNPLPKPLPPNRIDIDPGTGQTYAFIEDELSLPCSDTAIVPTMMATMIKERYLVGTELTASTISAGEVLLFDENGNAVTAIDRTKPGRWYAEQTFTDSDGNRTTLRLAIEIVPDSATGAMGPSAPGAGTSLSASDSNDSSGRKTTVSTLLPQTGGVFGPCPLHLLFLLMMLMAAAYTFMRLHQEQRDRSERSTMEIDENGKLPRRYHAFDALVHGVIIDGALILALFSMCPWDLGYALATVLMTAVCIIALARRPKDAPASTSHLTIKTI